jgi:hypothetical protein
MLGDAPDLNLDLSSLGFCGDVHRKGWWAVGDNFRTAITGLDLLSPPLFSMAAA